MVGDVYAAERLLQRVVDWDKNFVEGTKTCCCHFCLRVGFENTFFFIFETPGF